MPLPSLESQSVLVLPCTGLDPVLLALSYFLTISEARIHSWTSEQGPAEEGYCGNTRPQNADDFRTMPKSVQEACGIMHDPKTFQFERVPFGGLDDEIFCLGAPATT